MQKFIGLALVLLCVFGGFVLAKGRLIALWQPAELLIIIGAGVGALVIGNSRSVLKATWRQLRAVLKNPGADAELYPQLLKLLHRLLEEIRTRGLKVLDEHVDNPAASPLFQQYPLVLANGLLISFIADNLRMLTMGKIGPRDFEALLEQEIDAIEQDLLKPSRSLHKVADAMPGFGILAAVGGIIITMQYIDGPLVGIGAHVAAALVGTFIGIFCCYCLLEPASSAVAEWVGRQMTLLECVKAVLTAHSSGKTPLLSVDAGRKMLEIDVKPSFATLEGWVTADDGRSHQAGTSAEAADDNVTPIPQRRVSDA
ncbi:MAG: flagellar motor stator protein MotA [Spongiibacteraceae bacterium]|jgi:chemotaxis protein MotA|nr:flagellar motor stator protein MotA [Spongiibacteraceae bacterium]